MESKTNKLSANFLGQKLNNPIFTGSGSFDIGTE